MSVKLAMKLPINRLHQPQGLASFLLSIAGPSWRHAPVGGDVRAIVADWVAYLRTKKLFGFDDPLFPASLVMVGPEGQFRADGVARRHWSNAGPIRKIFEEAFERAFPL